MNEAPDYNYLSLLNEQQRAAVEYHDGPSLVIAGAGSGKTRVLTYKIVDMIRKGYEPYRILALTFTNKAAREMKDRIFQAVGERVASRLWMGTFHSIFLRILRRHADLLGYKSDFTIYNSSDSKSLIKIIIKDMELDEKVYKPSTIASVISNAKNALISPEQYNSDPGFFRADKSCNRPLTGKIYSTYVRRCKVADAMDFDDILVYMNVLLRDFPDVRRHYQDFFRYILVDEYQDTNFAQHLIVTTLSAEHQHLCVVGDDAQSIYSFRGANITNILSLDKQYPNLKTFKLERNYRSTKNIINAASSLIKNNIHQIPKDVFSEKEEGRPIKIVKTFSDVEEAFMVANMISESKNLRHDSLDDYAILYRTNAQSRVLEEKLRSRNMHYRIYGGLSFYQRKEVLDALAYFRLTVNPDDDEAFRRVINFPTRGIGDTTLKKLQNAAIANDVSLWRVICEPEKYSVDVNKGTLKKLNGFKDLISGFIEEKESDTDALTLGQSIINKTGMLVLYMHDKTPENISRQQNITELLAGLEDFVSMRRESGESASISEFLSQVSLATDQDSEDDSSEPKITLMTVHASKGLEFKHVYIVGMEEDLFPSSMSNDSPEGIEEERRLLYVAMTRAMETCTLSYAGTRFRNGSTAMMRKSRFLNEINPKFLDVRSSAVVGLPEWKKETSNSRYTSSSARSSNYRRHEPSPVFFSGGKPFVSAQQTKQPTKTPAGETPDKVNEDSLTTHSGSELHKGQSILHSRFGKGVIADIITQSNEEMIIVDFQHEGQKKLMLRFAKFAIL